MSDVYQFIPTSVAGPLCDPNDFWCGGFGILVVLILIALASPAILGVFLLYRGFRARAKSRRASNIAITVGLALILSVPAGYGGWKIWENYRNNTGQRKEIMSDPATFYQSTSLRYSLKRQAYLNEGTHYNHLESEYTNLGRTIVMSQSAYSEVKDTVNISCTPGVTRNCQLLKTKFDYAALDLSGRGVVVVHKNTLITTADSYFYSETDMINFLNSLEPVDKKKLTIK